MNFQKLLKKTYFYISGMRFGLMQAKIGLATVIMNFEVELSPEQEVPIEIHKRTIVILPANPVRLKFNKRKNTY